MIGDLLMERDLSVLNDGSTTYLHPRSGSQSTIDLSICDPSLYLYLSWQVYHDLCGSNHLSIDTATRLLPLKLTAAGSFLRPTGKPSLTYAASDLRYESVWVPDDLVGNFTNILINIANHSILKSKPKVVKHNTIWFNDECKETRKTRRKALKRVKTSPTSTNIENFKIIQAKARRIIKTTHQWLQVK